MAIIFVVAGHHHQAERDAIGLCGPLFSVNWPDSLKAEPPWPECASSLWGEAARRARRTIELPAPALGFSARADLTVHRNEHRGIHRTIRQAAEQQGHLGHSVTSPRVHRSDGGSQYIGDAGSP